MSKSEHTADRLRKIESMLKGRYGYINKENGRWLMKLFKKLDATCCWETTCLESARLWDIIYEQYYEIEKLKGRTTEVGKDLIKKGHGG